MPDARIQIAYDEFYDALAGLAVGLPPRSRDMEVRIDFDGALARMTTAGVEIRLEAKGRWTGFVLAPLRPLVQLRRKLPEEDPLTLRFAEGRLYVESWSIPASWHDLGSEPVDSVPINPTIFQLLQFKAEANEAQLVSSGLSSAVRSAENKAQKLMLKAQDILRPLGISLRDLEQLLGSKVKAPKR